MPAPIRIFSAHERRSEERWFCRVRWLPYFSPADAIAAPSGLDVGVRRGSAANAE
jgi:hypothetical protein